MTRAMARPFAFPAAVVLAILAGAAVRLAGGDPALASAIWLGALIVAGTPLVTRTVAGAMRGHWAADVVASLAIVFAVALGHGLAGLVVVLMQSGGESLEHFAAGRATRALRALEAAAPRIAHRLTPGGIQDVAVEDVVVGDPLLIRPGEMVPCDCTVESGESHLDTAAITGEPVPRRVGPSSELLSGTLNQEGALTVRASRPAGASQYARIVALVRTAQRERAPIQRIADRYAVWFTPLTLGVAALAVGFSGEWDRALAVLVIATPCPLILATPVAMIAGIDLAARHRLIVRTGGALEALASVTCVVFDKTGTLTIGRPTVSRIATTPEMGRMEALRLAAGLEVHSGHLLARSVVEAADALGIAIPPVTGVNEAAGRGVGGTVEGRVVRIGSRRYLAEHDPSAVAALQSIGLGQSGLQAGMTVDGRAAAVISFADRVRVDARGVVAALARQGIRRRLLLSGDHEVNARAVAEELGFSEVHGDLLAEDKVRMVRELQAAGERVLMVGDGTNDAPALAAATVGIAIGGRAGAGIATEAAEVVILADTPAPVADAVRIGRRTLRIARQSIVVGLGLSGLGMIVAAFGYIPPVVGALIQEGIDVAVILNALRAASLPGESAEPLRGRRRPPVDLAEGALTDAEAPAADLASREVATLFRE